MREVVITTKVSESKPVQSKSAPTPTKNQEWIVEGPPVEKKAEPDGKNDPSLLALKAKTPAGDHRVKVVIEVSDYYSVRSMNAIYAAFKITEPYTKTTTYAYAEKGSDVLDKIIADIEKGNKKVTITITFLPYSFDIGKVPEGVVINKVEEGWKD